jgi:phage terminase small subunit
MARYKRGTVATGVLAGLEHKKANFVIEYAQDFSPRRAAEAAGYAPDYGYKLRDDPEIAAAIDLLIATRLETSDITAEWVLMEAVDNALIAKQLGNISASNTALQIVGKHVMVDAFAADKLLVNNSKEVMDRLRRARDKLQDDPEADDEGEPVSFL